LPTIIVFGLMAYKYLAHPIPSVAAVGIAANSPLAVTVLRIFFGAFPLGCFLFVTGCMISTRRLLTGLAFVTTMTSAILIVRVLGMFADGTAQRNLPAAATEAVVLALTIVGTFMELKRRRQSKEAA
jgi:hypothetical protein